MANIFVNRESVGMLSREEPVNRFVYNADVLPGMAVSLLMPVTDKAYLAESAGALHPVFDMSLPEGALREAISRLFAKALPAFDDFELFRIVGRSLIGRLRFAPYSKQLDDVPPQNLKDLLRSQSTGELFAALLQRYAQYSGVSGIQPKVLVRDDGSLSTETFSPVTKADRLTGHGTTHLVKSFDPVKYPGLAVNEHYCLRAAKAAGLEVVKNELAEDGRLLVIERFDVKPDGSYLAFEDGCALTGRLAREKYTGSYEQLASTLLNCVRGPTGSDLERAKFFRSLVLSVAVRNGDAHRKNFGVVYDDPTGNVSLAPLFDVITTTPYLPQDCIALTLDGTKRWPDARRLQKFGMGKCGLTATEAKAIISEVADGVTQTARELDAAGERDKQSGNTVEQMRRAWDEGVASITERKIIANLTAPDLGA
jgi:serine/threonine-protein kinase HipA